MSQTLSFERKYQIRLVIKSLIFTVLVIGGITLVVSGLTYLNIFEIISNIPKSPLEKQEKEFSTYPEIEWIGYFSLNINPIKAEIIQSGEKIHFSAYVQSDEFFDEFSIRVFHEDFVEKYSQMLDNYVSDDSSQFPKFRSGAELVIDMENNNPEKCLIKNPDKEPEFIIRSDCSYDYNGSHSQVLETPGKYYAIFINESLLNQRLGYLHPVFVFTIKDASELVVKQELDDINYELILQKNENIKTEGYFFLGLGAGMLFVCITVYDSIAQEKRNFNYEKLKIRRAKSFIEELSHAMTALKLVTFSRDGLMNQYNSNSRDKGTVKKDVEDLKSSFGLIASAINRAETSELFNIDIEEKMRKLYREALKDVAISDEDKYVYTVRSSADKIEVMVNELEKSLQKFESELPNLSEKKYD